MTIICDLTIFHDFQGLENEKLKLHAFPGFPWPVRTLLYTVIDGIQEVYLKPRFVIVYTNNKMWIKATQIWIYMPYGESW